MSGVVAGVDPGGRTTGVVFRQGDRCLGAFLVERGDSMSWPAYLREVTETVSDPRFPVRVVAVEGLVEPTPQMGMTSVGGLMGTAMVLGAVLHRFPDAVEVAPGGHGSAPLEVYRPVGLVGARETKGAGRLRHCRSAWDVAGAPEVLTVLHNGQSVR